MTQRASEAIAASYKPATTKTLIDLTGRRFGRWVVVAKAPRKNGSTRWDCLCDCGGQKTVEATSLRRGLSTSCGCLSRTHGGYGTLLYGVWAGMLERCRNPKAKAFPNYGGRGIDVGWSDFASFRAWAIESGYAHGLTIERVDVNRGYGPANCTWITRGAQSANRRVVKCDSTGRPWYSVAQGNGIPPRTFRNRINKLGWPPERAATIPVRVR